MIPTTALYLTLGVITKFPIWEDTTECKIRCKACWENKISSKTKVFKNLKSLWLHCFRCFNFKNNLTKVEQKETIEILKIASVVLGKGGKLTDVPELIQWGVLIS